MTVVNGYCTLDELKARLDISTTDTADDTKLEVIIQAASRAIDAKTGRRFYATTADETRYYTAEADDVVFTDEIISVTSLLTDDDGTRAYATTWASTDYELEPVNAALDGKPYTRIELAPYSPYTFPEGVRRGIQITGIFGFCTAEAHPDVVREACLIQSARLFKRKDAPFGVVGSPELGQLQPLNKLDPDVELMLQGVTRLI